MIPTSGCDSPGPESSETVLPHMERRTLKIAILRQRYTPFGGAARIIDQAIRQFSERGHSARFTIVARSWKEGGDGDVEFRRCNPPFVGRTMRDGSFVRAAAGLTREGFDLVQAHERTPHCDIYRAGDGLHEDWLEALGRGLSGWRRKLADINPYHLTTIRRERAMFESSRVRAFIANSDFVAERIAVRYPSAASRTVVIRNGVDTELFHPRLRAIHRAEVRARLGVDARARIVTFVGSNWGAKGLGTAIHALAGLPEDVHLLVVGKERRPKPHRRLAVDLGVANRIHFIGQVADPRPFFGAADSFVLPSLFDAMPNAVLEAMASGLPVVVSSNSGARDLVTDSRQGFVLDPFAASGWSEAIGKTLTADALETMGSAAREVAEHHTLSRMAERWYQLYAQILTPRP